MHTALEHAHPQDQADDHIRPQLDHAQAVHRNQRNQARPRARQGCRGQVSGIEQGNDDDGAKVINDRQGHQEQLQRHWYALAQQGQNAQRKGNVGGHGDRPAGQGGRVVLVKRPVDQRRHHHAADGRCARQHHLRRLGQVTIQQLTLDLQADQQEKQGHQAIVDPKQRRLGDFQRANLSHHRRVEKGVVQVRQR